MMVFWWQGKGYWTLLLLFLVGMVATVLLQVIHVGTDGPWFAAAILAIAAAWNWSVGSRWNAAARRRPISGLWQRLSYRGAEHRFMSFPMESFSVVMAVGSILLLLRRLSRGATGI